MLFLAFPKVCNKKTDFGPGKRAHAGGTVIPNAIFQWFLEIIYLNGYIHKIKLTTNVLVDYSYINFMIHLVPLDYLNVKNDNTILKSERSEKCIGFKMLCFF